jgi:hypothetical protein
VASSRAKEAASRYRQNPAVWPGRSPYFTEQGLKKLEEKKEDRAHESIEPNTVSGIFRSAYATALRCRHGSESYQEIEDMEACPCRMRCRASVAKGSFDGFCGVTASCYEYSEQGRYEPSLVIRIPKLNPKQAIAHAISSLS